MGSHQKAYDTTFEPGLLVRHTRDVLAIIQDLDIGGSFPNDARKRYVVAKMV